MFITVDGLNKTGIPSALWDLMEPYSHVDRVSGVAVLAVVILVLSNLASNVPTGKWMWIYYQFNSRCILSFSIYTLTRLNPTHLASVGYSCVLVDTCIQRNIGVTPIKKRMIEIRLR